jgi:uncharacterized protein (UPF0254 family)
MSETSNIDAARACVRLTPEIVALLPAGTNLSERIRAALSERRSAEQQTATVLEVMEALSEDLHRIQRLLLPIYRYLESRQRLDDPEIDAELEQLKARIEERDERLFAAPRRRLAEKTAAAAPSAIRVDEG